MIKRLHVILLILLMTGIMVFFLFEPRYYLKIEDVSNGKTISKRTVMPGDNVWLVFINSVENLPVGDHFVIDKGYRILFEETIYMAPYAGYTQEDKATTIAPGVTRIPNIREPMDTVTFHAGYTYKHLLFLNGTWLPLYDVAKGGDLIEISIERESWISRRIASLAKKDSP